MQTVPSMNAPMQSLVPVYNPEMKQTMMPTYVSVPQQQQQSYTQTQQNNQLASPIIVDLKNMGKWSKPVQCKSTLRLMQWPSTSSISDIKILIGPSGVEPISIRELDQQPDGYKQYFLECATEKEAEKLKMYLNTTRPELEITVEKGVVKDLTNVYVTNLPPNGNGFTLNDLKQMFLEFGQIVSAKLINSDASNISENNSSGGFQPNGIAFVRFSKRTEADRAIQTINSKKVVLHVKPIECKYANKNVRINQTTAVEERSQPAVYFLPTLPMGYNTAIQNQSFPCGSLVLPTSSNVPTYYAQKSDNIFPYQQSLGMFQNPPLPNGTTVSIQSDVEAINSTMPQQYYNFGIAADQNLSLYQQNMTGSIDLNSIIPTDPNSCVGRLQNQTNYQQFVMPSAAHFPVGRTYPLPLAYS